MLFVQPLVRLFSDSDKVTEIAVSTCIIFHLFFGLFGIQSFVTTMLQSLGTSTPQRGRDADGHFRAVKAEACLLGATQVAIAK